MGAGSNKFKNCSTPIVGSERTKIGGTMNRSQRVFEVYRELRRSVPEWVAGSEILACSASLVELFEEEQDDSPQFDLRTGGLPFDMQALDIGLADGGWRVLCREWRWLGMEWDDG